MSSNTHFIVRSSVAKMPTSCWGRYMHVAVIEVQAGVKTVPMISTRAKGVVRIVQCWSKLSVGKTARCAYQRALVEAKVMAAELNAGTDRTWPDT